MIITKRALPRRTVLRGIGATVALPLLDSMVPALTALAKTPARPVRRFGVVYAPNGMDMQHWTPAVVGTAFEFSPILQPLAPFRDHLLVLSGLASTPPPAQPGVAAGVHPRASTRFLTGVPPKYSQSSEVQAGISADQMLAKKLGQQTQLASLELSMESNDFVGSCAIGYSCAYNNTISWRNATTPLPVEHNPRAVFERLFGDSGSTGRKARVARLREQRSVLDSVTEKVARLRRELGAADHIKLDQYVSAVRDVERRIQLAEEQDDRNLPVLARPTGIPATFEEHAKLMYDLQLLAYQSDLTRVVTFMLGHEITGRSYPEIGVPDAHHPISHHQGDPEKLAKLSKINTFHVTQFASFLDKLRSTDDGDGSLLDHLVIIYGAGMSDSNRHAPDNLPILVVGAGEFKGGRHIRFSDRTPLANLHLTLLDRLGVSVEPFGDGTGKLQGLTEIV